MSKQTFKSTYYPTSGRPYCDKNEFRLTLNVQQFRPADITIQVIGGMIIVKGNYGLTPDRTGMKPTRFIRRFSLPKEVRLKNIHAHLSTAGFLTITAPKEKRFPSTMNNMIYNERIHPVSIPFSYDGQPAQLCSSLKERRNKPEQNDAFKVVVKKRENSMTRPIKQGTGQFNPRGIPVKVTSPSIDHFNNKLTLHDEIERQIKNMEASEQYEGSAIKNFLWRRSN